MLYTLWGILVVNRISLKTHVQMMTRKISKSDGVLTKSRKVLNQKTLSMLYYGLVYPYLLYGTLILGNATTYSIAPFELYVKGFLLASY